MPSPVFSATVLPSLVSGGPDTRIEVATPGQVGTAIVEVRHAPVPVPGPNQIGIDAALQDARSRIAAIASLSPQEVHVSARAWQLAF
jgi:hypothetical protein